MHYSNQILKKIITDQTVKKYVIPDKMRLCVCMHIDCSWYSRS